MPSPAGGQLCCPISRSRPGWSTPLTGLLTPAHSPWPLNPRAIPLFLTSDCVEKTATVAKYQLLCFLPYFSQLH